ncbi:MAG: NADH-quinone oxidoreductase subunit A [Sediminibacterium sp.]|nr:NADH-quinone oxidoreductase subunit A [Sediminibacterium sp.]
MGIFSLIILLIAAIVFAGSSLLIGRFLVRRSTNAQKQSPYECGLPTIGRTIHQQHIGYYLFALLFLVFDVELIFLYPWAVVVKQVGINAFIEISFFIFILFLGFLYAHKQKAVQWN